LKQSCLRQKKETALPYIEKTILLMSPEELESAEIVKGTSDCEGWSEQTCGFKIGQKMASRGVGQGAEGGGHKRYPQHSPQQEVGERLSLIRFCKRVKNKINTLGQQRGRAKLRTAAPQSS